MFYPEWNPPWRRIADASGAVIAWSDSSGLRTAFAACGPLTPSASWVALWLRAFLQRQAPADRSNLDHTFLYVLVAGVNPMPQPDGRVDGVVVLEFGTGCAPAANPDGVEIEFDALVSGAIDALS